MSPWITNGKIYRVIEAILRILIRDRNLVNVATQPEKLSIVVQLKKIFTGISLRLNNWGLELRLTTETT